LGKGEKNGTKRMACVGGIYTIDRFQRSVDDVLDDIRRKKRQGDRPEPQITLMTAVACVTTVFVRSGDGTHAP
jgi:hypothetical protein